MSAKVHLEVIRSDDCFACRQCCHFSPGYASWAPLFTDEQRRRAQAEFAAEDLRFEPHGRMWRIVVREQAGEARLVCPLLDRGSGDCRVYSYGIFDCDLWPYEIAERDGRVLLTVTPDCPVVGERGEAIRARGQELLPRMLDWIRRHPENAVPGYEGAIVLADLGPARSATPAAHESR